MRDGQGMTRRRVLGIGGALGLMGATGLTSAAALARRPAATGAELRSAVPLPPPFQVPLPIPAVLKPVGTYGGADRYEIVQREASAEILPGVRTPLWTYDGTFPGPTIESRRGRPITVSHRNELPVPTVVHLHGGRTPAASDGYPTDLVLPAGWPDASQQAHPGMGGSQHHAMRYGGTGDSHAMRRGGMGDSGAMEHGGPAPRPQPAPGHGMSDPRAVVSRLTRDYTFPLDQRPTLLWYHDHRMDFTAPAIWRGLAGLHLVRDDAEDALGLPAGPRELPLMIADRAFAADGSLAYPSLDPTLRERPGVREPYLAGVLGDVILVNGAPWPVHEVDAARYRLRILNASNARHYELEAVTDDGRRLDLVQIGADQGLLAAPVTHKLLPIAPAERYDVVVDFSGVPIGGRVRLVNRLGSGRTRDVMAFRVARRAADDSRVPGTLSTDLPDWRRSDAVRVREFAFRAGQMHAGHGWLIGGLPFDPARTDVTARLGDVEVWRLVADVHHPVHLHLVGFRVLSRSGRPPLPHDAGLKDTVSLRPGEGVEIITRFDGYRGRYLFHCHNAEHEDMGMMANLEIV
ncbi:multicopper oxidase family protein [Nonomuraea roseoviolacea]|uniref:Multicopper oxidase CueO n=1 Tax=Nonomuraea roseoviolacea subsp. carminata TaxID=160689 RepID=A0ABT1JY67_9ACTN|nr:multicopper oxidase domain-containing protein [Nonomuraea roseoviolacea]MCP2345724.1 FtsP/CotA-like multicopper oxidase with cupredoxin domain [Nonomuraea roseoviolacea subsp. carminata]